MPEKKPFITLEQAQEIIADVPTPFHLYDEKGIRANARRLKAAFAWNPGFKEYFAVKACPNPFLMKILRQEGFGMDCSSLPELLLSQPAGIRIAAKNAQNTAVFTAFIIKPQNIDFADNSGNNFMSQEF